MNTKFVRTYFSRILISIIEFVIFVDFWVILAVSIWGGFSYRLVKIFDSYFEATNIIRPLVILVGSVGLWWLLKRLYPHRTFIDIFKNPYYYLISFLFVYSGLAIPVYLQPYYTFSYGNAHDFAARNHAIYNSSIGNILRSDIFPYHFPFRNWNFLGNNFSLITVFFAPIYYFFQDGAILIIFESIAIVSAAIPIFLIANRKLKNECGALIISLAYLFYSLVIRFPFYEFRQEYFAIPLLLFAFYNILKNRIGITLILLLFTALTREAGFLAVAVMGIYIFLCNKDIKYHRVIGFLVFVICILALLIIVEHIIPRLNTLGFYGFGPLGGKQRLIQILFNPKMILDIREIERIEYFINIFKFLGFLPLLSPIVLLAFPFLLQNWLTDLLATTGHIWHNTFIIPFLFISLIYGIHNISRILRRNSILVYIWLMCFSLSFGGGQFYRDIIRPFFEHKLYLDVKPDIYKEFCKAERHLPRNKSVFTDFALLPNLSNRERIFWRATLPNAEDVDTDYLFFSPNLLGRDENGGMEIEKIIEKDKYTEVFRSNNFIVMIRKDLCEEEVYIINDPANGFSGWSISTSHCDYKLDKSKDSFSVSIYLDGSSDEDEFIQMRITGLDVDLAKLPIFFLDYGLEDVEVQTIELVFGIDLDGDRNVDKYIKKIYPSSGLARDRWKVDVYDMVVNEFPEALCYRIVELELYPHKIYEVNCRGIRKGWYGFELGQLGFTGVKIKCE